MFLDKYVNKHLLAWLSYNAAYQDNYGQANHICYVAPQYMVKGNNYQHIEPSEFPNEGCIEVRLQNNTIADDVVHSLGHLVKVTINAEPYFNEKNTHIYNIKYNASYGKRSDLFMESFSGSGLYQIIDISASIDVLLRTRNLYKPQNKIYTSAILLRNGNLAYGPFDAELNGLKQFDFYVGEYNVLKFASELLTIHDEHKDVAAILVPRNLICSPDLCSKRYDCISDSVLINSFIETLRVHNKYTKDQISQLKTITQDINRASEASFTPERQEKLKHLLTNLKLNTSCCQEVLQFLINNEFSSSLIVQNIVNNHLDEIKDKLWEFSSIKHDLAELQQQKSTLTTEIAQLQTTKQSAEQSLQQLKAQSNQVLEQSQQVQAQVQAATVQPISLSFDLELADLIDDALTNQSSVSGLTTGIGLTTDPGLTTGIDTGLAASTGAGTGTGTGACKTGMAAPKQAHAQSVQGQVQAQSSADLQVSTENTALNSASKLSSKSASGAASGSASATTLTPDQAINLVHQQAQSILSKVPWLSDNSDDSSPKIIEKLNNIPLNTEVDEDGNIINKSELLDAVRDASLEVEDEISNDIDFDKAAESLINFSQEYSCNEEAYPSYRPCNEFDFVNKHSRQTLENINDVLNICKLGKISKAKPDIHAVDKLSFEDETLRLYPKLEDQKLAANIEQADLELNRNFKSVSAGEYLQEQDLGQNHEPEHSQNQEQIQDDLDFQTDLSSQDAKASLASIDQPQEVNSTTGKEDTVSQNKESKTDSATLAQPGNKAPSSDSTFASAANPTSVSSNTGIANPVNAVPTPMLSADTRNKLEKLIQLYKASQQTIAQLTQAQILNQDKLTELQNAVEQKDQEIKSLQDRLEISGTYFELTKKLTRLQEKYDATEREYEGMCSSKQQELSDLEQQGNQVVTELVNHAKQTVRLLDNKLVTQLMHSLDEEPEEVPVKFDPQVLHSHLDAQQIINRVYQFLEQAHRNPTRNEVANYLICLTQGFITTFAGEPGTGKTSLCNLLGKALGLSTPDEHNRFVEVAVERGWSSCKDLIGYYNPLTKTVVKSNIGVYNAFATLDVEATTMIAAEEQQEQARLNASAQTIKTSEQDKAKVTAHTAAHTAANKDVSTSQETNTLTVQAPVTTSTYAPFIVLLDEANLSPIEHYWATFLKNCDMQSSTHREISLGGNCSFKLPEHLRFFATVNFDHTTEELSPRFLDRSWIIMLDPNQIDPDIVDEQLDNAPDMVSFDDLKAAFSVQPEDKLDGVLANKLEAIQAIFRDESIAMPIMPRSLKMVRSYCIVAAKCMECHTPETRLAPLDYAFAQKVLPTLNGSGDSYKKLINALLEECDDKTMPLSAKHLKRMARIAERNMGFYQFFAR